MKDNEQEERFWERVSEQVDGCWRWTGAIKVGRGGGYGKLYVGRVDGRSRYVRAHRFAYELLVGPIPDHLVTDHLCRNRWCVNPGHLELVTQEENKRRGKGSGGFRKTHCVRGHERTPENLYTDPKNPSQRHCRRCKAMHRKASKARQKVAIQ